jgi:hypothetical protein
MRSVQAPATGKNPSPALIVLPYSRFSLIDTTAVPVENQSVTNAYEGVHRGVYLAHHAKLMEGIHGWKFPAIQQKQMALFYPSLLRGQLTNFKAAWWYTIRYQHTHKLAPV